MSHLEKKDTLPKLVSGEPKRRDPSLSGGITSSEFAKREKAIGDVYRSHGSPDWFIDHPMFNAVRIIEESKDQPAFAALMCFHACQQLNLGHHKRLREYLVSAYSVAIEWRNKGQGFEELGEWVADKRSPRGVDPEKVKENLLHYMFIFVFYVSGLTTRNRATQYAMSLQDFYDENASLEAVESNLLKYGQEKLYRAVAQRKALMRGAELLEEKGQNPATITLEKILESMSPPREPMVPPEDDDVAEIRGSRDLFPDDGSSDEITTESDLLMMDDDATSEEAQAQDDQMDSLKSHHSLIVATDRGEAQTPEITRDFIFSLAGKSLRLGVALANKELSTDDRNEAIHMSIKLTSEICDLFSFIGLRAGK